MWLITKEAVTGIVRTFVPYLYGLLIAAIPPVGDFFAEIGFSVEGAVVAVGTLIYILVRALAERWGWLGNLLIFNTKPSYG